MTVSASHVSRSTRLLFLFVVCPLVLSGCPKLLCDFGISDLCETYTVTYAPNGEDRGSVPFDSSEYQERDTVTVLTNIGGLADSGYSFDGWNTADNGAGTSYSVGATFAMGFANVTLYAEWSEDDEEEEATYAVTYDDNGSDSGSVPTDSNNYENGDTAIVLGNTGSLGLSGYSFVGWGTASDGSGTTHTTGNTFILASADVTLYAQRSLNATYTVTYNRNGADSGSTPTDSTSYENGTTVTVLDNTGNLVLIGYTFTGWNSAAEESGPARAPDPRSRWDPPTSHCMPAGR